MVGRALCMTGMLVGVIHLGSAQSRGDFILGVFAGAGTQEGGLLDTHDANGFGASVSATYEVGGGDTPFTSRASSFAAVGSGGAATLHVRAHAQYDGDPVTAAVAQAIAEFTDLLTVDFDDEFIDEALAYVHLGIDGSMSSNGAGSDASTSFARFALISSAESFFYDTRTNSGSPPAELVISLGDFTEFVDEEEGILEFPFDLSIMADAWAFPTQGVADADFGNTVRVRGLSFTDRLGNPLTGTISSALGFDYSFVASVPAPGSWALLASAAPFLAGSLFARTRRRRAGQAA